MSEHGRAHVIIRGRVQGVFFRVETRRAAESLGVKGWVRNLPDGAVEAVFEGPPRAVEKAVEWCRSGPPTAAVREVRVTWGEESGEFDRFSIVR